MISTLSAEGGAAMTSHGRRIVALGAEGIAEVV